MDHPPSFSPDQLRYLDRVFPNRCARAGMLPEDVWSESGARRVIDKIASLVPGRHAYGEMNLDLEALGVPASRKGKR